MKKWPFATALLPFALAKCRVDGCRGLAVVIAEQVRVNPQCDVSWTTEYLTGWNRVTGQGKPLLGD